MINPKTNWIKSDYLFPTKEKILLFCSLWRRWSNCVTSCLLCCLFAAETTIFSQAKEELVTTTNTLNFTSSLATPSTMNTSAVARQTQTTNHSTTDVTSASPKTPRTTEATPSDTTTANTTSSQAANGTTSQEQTVQLTTESQNGTGSDAMNTSSPGQTTGRVGRCICLICVCIYTVFRNQGTSIQSLT